MRRFALFLAFLVGCYNEFRPGRCNQTSDCGAGLVCDLAPTPQGNGRCVATDGGQLDGDGGGVDSGDTGPECVRNSDCPSDRPACSPTGACVGCDAVPNSCAQRGSAKPLCGPGGVCVECVSDSDCARDVKMPICDTATNACARCSTDAQCAAKLGADPGICMSHQDGRCATGAETIFVHDTAGCASAPGGSAGSPDMPFCTMQPAIIALASNRRLIVVRGSVPASNYVIQGGPGSSQITVVGQTNAAIGGGTYSGLVVDGGDVFVRDISFKVSINPGVIARNGALLHLINAVVDFNAGGGVLIDGAGFEIRNSTITRNGPATTGQTTWGGILIQNLPPGSASELDLVTVQNNNQVGISCSGPISGIGVLASDNAGGVQVTPTCQLTLCPAAGPGCGAQQP